ncbi:MULTISPECIES: phosphotransferase [Cyanophyceae]|uniref:phosphotransferase n=1 Tax=Cyanophyceae TaxID=3028117 RepID=UPI00232AD738|nr:MULTISPECIES: phosphotransferase [Cyanophyceae]MDB9354798.1 phosphotransferase [Nodularia spumigena CS-587/03]MDB9316481.1 phosphotransferase [Nodularia spumigena CS-590/01A]MDB9322222.1 phosphotransferase [Nodularia spumigena CS-591/07A]MDB9324841.1 phosphotransferase [Nodularia spumigena CS-590/02]MDB9329130.1 phosphotransferase [Nodularia spumigena CS-591/04]
MTVFVSDRFDCVTDSKMPFLSAAIDPVQVEECFCQGLAIAQNTQLHKIELIRYKPGRRCLIAYELINDSGELFTLIGKVRAKGTDFYSYELQKSLWEKGFADDSADGISVPEPVGIIPQWQMWLQRQVKGNIATQFLTPNNNIFIAKRIAEVAHKLHQTNILPRRSHTMSDELRILHERITLVMQQYPEWQERLERILAASNHLGQNTPEPKRCGIHRDFYPDQLIINNSRLYLIDLDLYCEGNPGLDIGNYIAHIKEYSLRTFGNSEALRECETSLTERFMQLTNDKFRFAIESYTTLTLVRHIYISTQFPERRPFTAALLHLCEQRLHII